MAEVLVIGKKISEMGLVNEITGEEKIPTSALGDKAVTTSQLLTYVNNNGVAQWGRIGGDITNQTDLQNQFTQERDTLKSYTQEQVSQQQEALQAHVDATNEAFGYARDNGSALPYKEGVSYNEGAVVVKDGVLQQLNSGVWKSVVAYGLSDTIQTFNTPQAGVDPVTGVGNGAYYNVRSTDDDSFLDEYQNIGGVPTPSGKSYPSSSALSNLPHNNLKNRDADGAHPASAISDSSGKTQQQINDNQKDINTVLNKTGTTESLAESVDATPFLQSLIDAMPDGMTLDLLGKTFRVKKNTGFVSDYPKGDQPCLVVKANNITITNGKLIVKEHGQGILDSFGENLNLVGVTLQGAGNFPLLDGNTGRGEKGFTNGGYYNEALHNSGMPKNNSVDTSGLSTGGYGGNFPQWGGGTAPTWGTWNGGFIFNEGSGLTVKGGSAVVEYCDISGFNGYGCLAEGGSLEVKNSEIHHIYTSGVHGKVIAGKVVDVLCVQNNNIHHIGHPDALNTNLYADPGYGVSTSNGGATNSGVRKYIVENNDITFCRRKGIDAHHGYDISIQNNLIEDCGTGVNITIYTLGKNPIRTLINGNTVRRIHHSLKDATMGIFVECNANLSRFTGSAIVTNNKVEGVGLLKSVYDVYKAEWAATAAGIVVCGVHDATVTGNTVDSTADYVCNIGIADGLSTALNTPVIDISHNTIRGSYLYGIFSIAGTNTTSNATIPNRGGIIGNKLDVNRRVDATGNTYNIYSSPVIKVANNSLVERAATMQNYYQPNMEGQSVAIRVDISAGTASLVDRSNLVSPYYAPTITKVSGQLRISLPANSTLRFASISEAANLRTATHTPIFHTTGSSSPTQYLSLSFYRASGDTVVSVSVDDIVGGVLDIKLDLK